MTETTIDPYSRRKTVNVVLLGVVFMLLASRTPISIVKTVLYSATDATSPSYIPTFSGDGFLSNSLLYSTFAVSTFLAPWVISKLGPRYTLSLKPSLLHLTQKLPVLGRVWLHIILSPASLPVRLVK